jgi:hypothetical protein
MDLPHFDNISHKVPHGFTLTFLLKLPVQPEMKISQVHSIIILPLGCRDAEELF